MPDIVLEADLDGQMIPRRYRSLDRGSELLDFSRPPGDRQFSKVTQSLRKARGGDRRLQGPELWSAYLETIWYQ